jgi:hypothetical protein
MMDTDTRLKEALRPVLGMHPRAFHKGTTVTIRLSKEFPVDDILKIGRILDVPTTQLQVVVESQVVERGYGSYSFATVTLTASGVDINRFRVQPELPL